MRWLVGMVIAHSVVACYHPDTVDCTLQCSAPTDCAGGQSCANGWCANTGVSCTHEGQPVTIDGAVNNNTPDASNANALCQQGCTKGTCQAGVCVIDCSEEGSCQMDVACPANLPCRVICGDNSCTKKVNCTMATSCDVRCSGQNACGDEVQCSPGECDVACTGAGSCKRRTKCGGSCACDVTCSGPMSCMEVSECPSATCRVGNGCSSIPTGCDTCN
jgi:hypothetical protein